MPSVRVKIFFLSALEIFGILDKLYTCCLSMKEVLF